MSTEFTPHVKVPGIGLFGFDRRSSVLGESNGKTFVGACQITRNAKQWEFEANYYCDFGDTLLAVGTSVTISFCSHNTEHHWTGSVKKHESSTREMGQTPNVVTTLRITGALPVSA